MKTNLLMYGSLMTSLIISFCSCEKQVQVDPPSTSITVGTIFGSDNSAIAAQLNLYASMPIDCYYYHLYSALSSDEYSTIANGGIFRSIYTNSLTSQGDAGNIGIWSPTYNYLYRVNAILEGIAGSNGMSDFVKTQTKGEALFMRGYFDFYLTNFYGDVPIVNSTDYKANSNLPRAPQSQVYQQVINDLRQAQSLLSTNYLDATDLAVSTDRIRPTKWAATALLARAYLYNKNWAGADSAASVLINNPNYELSPLTGNNSVFMKNSAEAIWQITGDLSRSQFATLDGLWSILTTAPTASMGQNCWTISPQLLGTFEINDQRKVNWVGAFSQDDNIYYFPYKYKDGPSATTLHEYTMMLRLGEQYLIRAEARANNNNPTGAMEDLNAIRGRAGLPDYTGSTDNASLLTAILHERQVELFGEAHRWFDLRRAGVLDAVMGSPGNATIAKGGVTWNSYQQYYPIRQSDVDISPNLTQTLGY